jgi:ABC-2 type transport system permease protein
MKDMPDVVAQPPMPREYQGANWEGLRTLYVREVRRFWKVGAQTLLAPVVTALLYMLVFVVAVRGAAPPMEGVRFANFVAPGLIMMQILGNAFSNSSSSLLQAKMNGLIGDFITPPLSPAEQVGLMAAIWSVKFDHIAAVSNFIIMPMTFLSGTFYVVDRLPEPFRSASQYNPFFYLISGFRYGFIGHADGSLTIGVVSTAGLCVALTAVCYWMFATGYKLKT